jgi:nucleotide-binding universal stress UspA family protein
MADTKVFRKILFATDGSSPSLVAQELTSLLAKKLGSKVTVVHVVSHELMIPQLQEYVADTVKYYPHGIVQAEMSVGTQAPTPSAAPLPERLAREATSIYREEGEDILNDAVSAFREDGLRVERKMIEQNDTAKAIVEEAQKGDYDTIVIGQSGEKESESHLGSVALKVSNSSKVPVLIARERKSISKILVPIDGSKSAEKALQLVAALGQAINAKVTLLHVQEAGMFRLRPDLTKAVGERILGEGAKKLQALKPEQKMESGDPGKKITEVAQKEDYDLIIMGCKGHGALGRFLLGDVTNHVLHYTLRSVLVAK